MVPETRNNTHRTTTTNLTDLTGIDRHHIGQSTAYAYRKLTDLAPPYKGGQSVKSVSTPTVRQHYAR